MTPPLVRELHDRIAALRPADEPFDVCVAAPGDEADELEAAGATWLLQVLDPRQPVTVARSLIDAAPPRR